MLRFSWKHPECQKVITLCNVGSDWGDLRQMPSGETLVSFIVAIADPVERKNTPGCLQHLRGTNRKASRRVLTWDYQANTVSRTTIGR
jgi:hypothetical protein